MEKMNPVKPLFPHLPERLAGLERSWWKIFGGAGIRAHQADARIDSYHHCTLSWGLVFTDG